MDDFPKILYKYIEPEGAKKFLASPQLHFTDWRKLDDLMEVIPGTKPLTIHELHALAVEESRKRGLPYDFCRRNLASMGQDDKWERDLRKLFDDQACTLFLCCLTERWNSGAMWALYAAEHTGIVFGIKSKDLPERARRLGKVEYSQVRPLMPIGKTDVDILTKAVITKSKDWDYQDEWRAASGSGEIEPLSPGAVAEIIVGYDAAPNLVEAVRKFVKISPSTRIFHAYPHPQRHEMERKKLKPLTR